MLFALLDLYGTDKTGGSLNYNVLHFAQSSDWILALTLRVGKGDVGERVGVGTYWRVGGRSLIGGDILSKTAPQAPAQAELRPTLPEPRKFHPSSTCRARIPEFSSGRAQRRKT